MRFNGESDGAWKDVRKNRLKYLHNIIQIRPGMLRAIIL